MRRGRSPRRSTAERARAWLWCFALLGSTSWAQATILADWELGELVRRADRVVIGTVVSQRTVDAPPGSITALMTESTVRVEETLRGASAKTLVVSQLGGARSGRRTWIEGDARLVEGKRMLLFTSAHPDGRRYLVGMALGAFFVDGDSLSQRIGETSRVRSLVELRALLRKAAE